MSEALYQAAATVLSRAAQAQQANWKNVAHDYLLGYLCSGDFGWFEAGKRWRA